MGRSETDTMQTIFPVIGIPPFYEISSGRKVGPTET